MKTNYNITSKDTLGDTVARLPRAGEVFKSYKIDFCCGGQRSIEEAAKEKDVDAGKLLGVLNSLQDTIDARQGKNFTQMNNEELIDHIIDTHHSYLNINLPEISIISAAVLRAHGASRKELFEVHKLFHALKAELEQHLIKEETVLFPNMLDENNDLDIQKEIEDEHEGAGEILRRLRELTQDYTVPADGCPTYERLYHKLEELEGDVFQHVHLENNILFKRF
ncbi:iron-sulfur cluster repair di-iron protein [Alkalibacter saccharofermentans]|uniref:Regulator of cell morphogenesis and NO signaling n=1 Tax=Alkalibacter saccharofermentans DSM 14828 TaxID=1120975 RepID=A0A1M4WMX4_9FIRM|nr:iron-sulfur cluster repair di-iron protein [Alkalibacter saccharofermentans]SHE82568.1 regulator of cell morphogenesis and NO signaling [Alkalibacter saccharofermentans DSM 14828]